jgi:hypothetical protein
MEQQMRELQTKLRKRDKRVATDVLLRLNGKLRRSDYITIEVPEINIDVE